MCSLSNQRELRERKKDFGRRETEMESMMKNFQSTESFRVKSVDRLVEAKDDTRAQYILKSNY